MSMNKSKKIVSIVAAATLALSAFAFSGCGDKEYKGASMDGYDSVASVVSNGGFSVEKGDFVYFINGKEDSTASNVYGKVTKGALYRISKADLAAGNGQNAKLVVPSLLVSGNYDSGIYIYGDYVYYASPTTDKTNAGQVANSSLDFKRAKLDGSEAPMGGKDNYFFRLSSNSGKYRFVEDGPEGAKKVYCLYEEDGALKSYDTSTGKTTVLVKGASTYYYDTQKLDSPVVYYTMSVSQDIDKTTPTSQTYNQIFSVTAGASCEVEAATASYKAKDAAGNVVAQYDFDESFLKDNAEESGYELEDYTTYPYVNLGQLVLDGIGSMHAFPGHVVTTEAQQAAKASATEFGYTYTLQQQTNDGLYFTRELVNKGSDEKAKLCYIPNTRSAWDAIAGNGQVSTVATDTTTASASAIYTIENGVHSYLYLTDSILKKTTTDGTGKATETISLAHGVSSATLWKVDGDYLYYYGDGTNGKSLSRINYKGTKEDYNFLGDEEEFSSLTISLVDWSDSWYKPEFVSVSGKTMLLYPNAQSYGSGSTAYNYIYAATLGTTAEIKANNEKIDQVNEHIDSYSSNAALQALMTCYFRTGTAATYETDEEVKALYTSYQEKEFEHFKWLFSEGIEFEGMLEKNFIFLVGEMKEADAESVADDWANSLLTVTIDEEDIQLEGWQIALIVCGVALAVIIAVGVPVLVVLLQKKKKAKEKEERIVNAYKRKKLDTTDDKSIDVYAEEESVEDAPIDEVLVEETVEEAPVEDAAEAPVEE